jgi:ssDNA-binding Zn-finger/Zn-ribbon topoisomerase 1
VTFRYDEVKCPDCGGEMISRTGKFGVFWGCKKFPECKGTRDSEGRSKQERQSEKAEKDIFERAEGKEWPRNERDKISWNKK